MNKRNAPDFDAAGFARRIKEYAAGPGKPAQKRFYEAVTVTGESGGFGIALDRRPLRTPARAPLVVPTRALAETIAEEWAAQGEHIVPATMVLTRLANTAIDRVAGREQAVAEDIVAYGSCDLLCYRADSPERLAARQADAWDPLLTWAARRLGSHFVCVAGVVHHPQPDAALKALARELEHQGAFRLAALHTITTLTGSAVLALALREGAMSADAAWAAAHVDEDWQIEQWGPDAEAEARRAARRREFDCAMRLLELV
ncbi:MAG: ATP12 family chaperone protein [Hyphomicrobiales bacterium]